jgi:hypothetical protein
VRVPAREEEERSVVTMVAVTAAVVGEERRRADWRRTLAIAVARRLMGWCRARRSGGRGQSGKWHDGGGVRRYSGRGALWGGDERGESSPE